jgi:DNA-binding PadR family transcriptional regulator
MQDKLPGITHLQFLVLGLLQAGEHAGREIRDVLVRYGVKSTAAAFYQMMARLERDRLIEGWYEQITIGDQAVTERRYRLRPTGERLWREARAFYASAPPEKARRRLSDA